MSIKDIAKGRSDIYRIDPKVLNVRPSWNGRDFADPTNQEHVDMLAQSIAEIGVKEPLTVVWAEDKAWIVDGECRWRATMRAMEVYHADIKTIPVKTEDRYANDADRLFSQIVRNSGKPFSGMEAANVYRRLLDMGWQQQDIAKKAGLSAARISQVLDLLTMPEPIKQMVTNGSVSASLATKTLAEHNPGTAVKVLQDAVAVAQSEGKEKALPKHVEAKAARKPRDPNIEKLVREAFEYADVNDEQMDDQGKPVVLVTFPVEWFEKIREALKL